MPGRQNKRWLDGDCPRGVLAIYDDPRTFDRLTIFYADTHTYQGVEYVNYRGMSTNPTDAQGFGISGEMTAWRAAQYRYANRNRAAKWSTLPEAVKALVRRDLWS